MKKKPTSKSAFFSQRVLIAFSFCLIGVVLALAAFALYPGGNAFAQNQPDVQAIDPQTVSEQIEAPDVIGVCDTAGPVEVEATAGTLGPTAYPTLAAALAAINLGTHQGVINVEICGNTVETATMVLHSSGAGAASYTSILIRPLADGLTVAGPSVVGRGLIELNGADNVTIDGDNPNTAGTNRNLTIQNNAANTINFTSVVRIALATTVTTSADNVTIRNCNIIGSAPGRNIAAATSTTASENTTFGIFAGPGASTVTPTTDPSAITSVSAGVGTGATATNFTVTNNNFSGSMGRSISANGSATTVFPGLLINNNTIGNPVAGSVDQVTSIGITAQGSTNAVISGNTVYVEGFVASSVASHGIEVGVNSSQMTGATIERNKVSRVRNNEGQTWSAYGINLGGGSSHVVRNNFVFDVRNDQTAGTGAFSTTFGAFGIRVGTGTGHQVLHNSVHLFGVLPGAVSTDLVAAFSIVGTGSTGMDVRNNIFSNVMTGGNPTQTNTRLVAIHLPSGATVAMNLILNNNDYVEGTDLNSRMAYVGTSTASGGFTAADFDPANTTPATNFRAYTSTLSAAGTNDNASQKVNPLFVSNTDLHLTGASPLLDDGAAAGVLNDIDGDVRNAVTPDIGADEVLGGVTPTPTATASATVAPTATPSATASASATATPSASASASPCTAPNVIVDGGFETGGIPSSTWDPETSTNFGTPLCDVPSCGTGGGASPPRTGAFWLWFGGIPAIENATLGQTVTFPSGGNATLRFWMRVGTVSSPFTDVVNVRVDGVIQQTFTEPTVAEGAYTERVINLNAFANGAAHALLFEYIGPSSGTGSFVIDDVTLTGVCATPTPSATPSGTVTPPATPTPTATPSASASASASPPGGVPANDQCAGAIVIPPSGPFPHLTAPVDITLATTTGDPPLPSCQTSVSRSIWYTFTPAVTGSYTISSCQTEAPASTLPDIVLAIYTGASCAGPFTQLPGVAGCDDDSCTTLALQAIISNTTLTAGTQYFILAHKFGAGAPTAPADDIQFRVSLATPPSPTPTPSGTITPPASPTPGVSVVWALWTTPASGAGTARLVTFSPTAPQTFTIVGDTGINTTSNFPNGLDFDNANNLFATGGTNTNFLFSVNQTTGVATLIGGSGLAAGQTVVDLAYDRLNNRMLGVGSGTNPVLLQINTATGAATALGTITGTTETVAVSLACRASDGAIFMHGVATDRWYNVNPTTFVATPLAVLPFDTNFGQGGTFDPNNGTLYHAAFNSTAFQGQLHTINPATGASTFVGNMGDLTNPQPNQISDIAIRPTGGPSPTPFTPTPTPSVTATPCPGGTNVILDGTFEAGSPWTAWTVQTSTNFGTPMCDVGCGTGGGTAGGFGGSANWAWFGGTASAETATAGQSVVIASGGVASLTFQLWIGAVNAPFTDVLNVRVDGTIVQSFPEPAVAEPGYTQRTVNLNAFANGASHAILFEYIGPGGAVGNFSVDNVTLVAGGACPSATPSATASPSASCVPSSGWSAGPNAPPVGLVRAPGSFFPTNGRFYSIGGRSADVAGADFVNPFEYDPVANTWATKPSTLPDGIVNNMACGVLNPGGGDLIYCVGGSQSQVVGTTGRVFTYNPATDTFAVLTGDEWPGSQTNTFLPGGFAVHQNRLYIIGSFNANAVPPVVTNQVWRFDPTAAVGSKWVARANFPVTRGYVPAAAIGAFIYTAGGSNLDPGGLLIDTADSFRYDPVADAWTTIANIPRATGETRAVVMNGQMWVLGGGRTAPNPSNQVNIYTPGTDTWSLGAPFTTGRRNFPADSNGTDRIFLAGGYDASGTTLLNSMEIFGTGICASPTPSATPPTPTPTPTATPPTPTPTVTPASPTPTVPPGTPTPTVTPGVSPPAQAVNLSTRMRVQTGDRVGIGGFIVSGSGPKNVIVRAIGPSLVRFGIDPADVLADPTLELRSSSALILANNNWKENAAQRDLIEATGLPPTNDLESAIVATLNPGQYTAIVRGNGGTSGVALVEVYDLNQSSGSQLANLSTRAFVSVDDDIVIAGFILGNNGGNDNVIVRGIGPSLAAFGVTTPLANPTLELRDNNGALLLANNDWQDNLAQAALITAAGLAPSNNLEAAIAATLPPGLYTALLAGLNGGVGNGLVEVYDLGAPPGGGPGPSPTPPGGTPTPPPSPSPGITPPPASPTPPPTSPTPTPPPVGNCVENFDGPPPALPAGWIAELASGDPPSWETTTGSPDGGNGPNLFVNDQDGISEKRVISRNIVIGTGSHVLSFRNNYDTEYDPPPAEVFWDGYVLDISTDGGTNWIDIIDAGATCTSGCYTGEITGQANNPIAGRQAWCGDSGGYINTSFNLPASLNGQTIKLRFIMGTDEALAQPGAHVDVLTITNASCP